VHFTFRPIVNLPDASWPTLMTKLPFQLKLKVCIRRLALFLRERREGLRHLGFIRTIDRQCVVQMRAPILKGSSESATSAVSETGALTYRISSSFSRMLPFIMTFRRHFALGPWCEKALLGDGGRA
jgi:hypothetical protein